MYNPAIQTSQKKLLLSIGAAVVLVAIPLTVHLVLNSEKTVRNPKAETTWAFEETFDYGAPTTTANTLLPKNFDFVNTHRNHPDNPSGPWGTFPADHGSDCSPPPTQHNATANHNDNTKNPGQAFYLCANHMMSTMGDVDAYSVANFYPRQEFDFANGGTLEFDASIYAKNGEPMRSFWEVVIVPREELQLAPAISWLPVDERYPKKRMVFRFTGKATRELSVGTGALDPAGEIASAGDTEGWNDANPGDPAAYDRRIRRLNRITFTNNKITWGIQKQDGTFRDTVMNIPQGLPFTRGIVMFKVHAYTPEKDGNTQLYTTHWDNIRFTGPKLTPFEGYEADGVLNLMKAAVGTTKNQTINLPRVGTGTKLLGQMNFTNFGSVQLSINGNPYFNVVPHSPDKGCYTDGWATFYMPINASQLRVGDNTLTWKVGPKAPCSEDWTWGGYSIKATEIQMDATGATNPPPPPPADSTPPAVSLTAPVAGNVSGTVNIAANASDNVGVAKVEFYDGPTLITADIASPYTASWNTTTLVNGNSHDLTAKATDTAGNQTTSAVVRVTINNTVVNPPPPPPPSGTGFTTEYFLGKNNFSGTPLVTRTENNINLDWDYDSKVTGVPVDNFSVRWTGTFNFDATKYRLNVRADDGLRVYVDNVLVRFVSKRSNQPILVSAYKNQAPTLYNGILDMTGKAGNHSIRVEYYEDAGQAMAKLNWVKIQSCLDMTADLKVDDFDLERVANFFNLRQGTTGITLPWDVNSDKVMNVLDLSLVAKKNGTTCQ